MSSGSGSSLGKAAERSGADRAPPSVWRATPRAYTPSEVRLPSLPRTFPLRCASLPSRCLFWSSVPAPGARAGVGTSFPRGCEGGAGVCPLQEPALQGSRLCGGARGSLRGRRPRGFSAEPPSPSRGGSLLPGEDGFPPHLRITACAYPVGNGDPLETRMSRCARCLSVL